MAALWAGIRLKVIALGWTWMLPLGTAITMTIGWFLGEPDRSPAQRHRFRIERVRPHREGMKTRHSWHASCTA